MSGGLASTFTDAEDSPGLLLWRVTNSWQAAQRSALKPLALTHVQFVLLAAVTWLTAPSRADPAGVTQQQLSAYARTDPMMTSQVVRALETLGLVTRDAHPTDGRARVLATTEAGRALADRAVAVVEACDRDFFGPLEGDQQRFT
ncbi:MAG: MarR family winged helix-turn-helix transcriptional regulator, partial [Nakamurella sp.]